MLYTVFNYLPVIEEEVTSKHQQTSKTQKIGDGDPASEDESCNGHEDLFQKPGLPVFYDDSNTREHFSTQQLRYLPPLKEKCTPPPRFAA